jgi:hypothetical protein
MTRYHLRSSTQTPGNENTVLERTITKQDAVVMADKQSAAL